MSKVQTKYDVLGDPEWEDALDNKAAGVDPILYIGNLYLKSLEKGFRLQSRTTDNYLRIHIDETGLVIQRQKPQ